MNQLKLNSKHILWKPHSSSLCCITNTFHVCFLIYVTLSYSVFSQIEINKSDLFLFDLYLNSRRKSAISYLSNIRHLTSDLTYSDLWVK